MSEAPDPEVAKYDRMAPSYSSRYVDPGAIAAHQLHLVRRWGEVPEGGRVLELGCADGLLTERLAAAGYDVTAVDFSPAMVDHARARLDRAGLRARVEVGDARTYEPDGPYDVVVALMWTFFHYVPDAAPALARLAAHTRHKLLVDVNPRTHDLGTARALVRGSGLPRVDWRPFFVPQRTALPPPVRALLRAGERVPGLRALPLRVKFAAVVRGRPAGGGIVSGGGGTAGR